MAAAVKLGHDDMLTRPTTWSERIGALRNLPPFLAMVFRSSPVLAAIAFAARLLRALTPIASLLVGKFIIDEIVHLNGLTVRPAGVVAWLGSNLLSHLRALVLVEFALAVGADLLGRLVLLVDELLSDRVSDDASILLMEHAATLDLADFEDAGFQDRLERARIQASGRMSLMAQLFGHAQDIVTVISFAAGLVFFAPWLMALLALALVPSFLGEAHFNSLSYALSYVRTPQRRELDYIRKVAASADTAKEIKIFDLSSFLINRYRAISLETYDASRRLALRRAVWGSGFAALGTTAYYAAYAYIAWRAAVGSLSIGGLSFLAASFLQLRRLLEGLLTGFSTTAGQALFIDDLFSFLRAKPGIRSLDQAVPFPRPVKQGFVFEDVGFRYPGAERWAVRHLTFTLEPGEVLALVGENGAGKTTLVKLLTRLYDPVEGRVLLDGRDLRDYDLKTLHASIGVIFQDFVRYNLSAADNIAVGRIEARDDRQRITTAATSALADSVVAKLPEGYDQMIGKRFHDGVDLSGGEWQKIAIARAYMREAEILILDEPTASLDARAEYEVFQRFRELSAGRSAVLISHRFSSVRMADRILVLNNGHLEAIDTHANLLTAGGRYAELFELQASGYR